MPSFVKICTTAQYFKCGDDAETGWRAHVPNYYFLRREAGGYWSVILTKVAGPTYCTSVLQRDTVIMLWATALAEHKHYAASRRNVTNILTTASFISEKMMLCNRAAIYESRSESNASYLFPWKLQ